MSSGTGDYLLLSPPAAGMSSAAATGGDTSGDAALARRLQLEEQRGAGGGARAPAQGGPRPARGNARANIMQQAVQDQAQAAVGVNNPKCTAVMLAVLNLPQALAVVVVLALIEDPFACDRPLAVWCIVSAVRHVLTTVCMAAMARYYPELQTAPQWARFLASLYQPLSTFGLVWFIFGNLWYISSSEEHCSGPLRDLALSLVIIQYIVMFLPCLVLIISLPFVCFCFPVFLRVMTLLNPPPAEAGRGVTQAQILGGTRLVKWTPGMFGPSADDNTCSITMDEYSEGDQVRVLPCEHNFSDAAITQWLRMHNTCPLCRRPITEAAAPVAAAGAGAGAGNRPPPPPVAVTTVHVTPAGSSSTAGPAPGAGATAGVAPISGGYARVEEEP